MNPNTEPELDDIIADFLLASESGKTVNVAEVLARHPQHAGELAAFFTDYHRFGGLFGVNPAIDAELTQDYRAKSSTETKQGKPFGGYELLNEIGQGGMGTVYRARVTGTSLIVALKQLRTDVHAGGSAQQFRDEIERAAELKHPNIVPVYHVGEQDGKPFFTMAHIDGGSLDQQIDRFHDQPRKIATLIAKIARGVHYAHQRRLLHRDLKPANILLDSQGEPLVADFGLATRTDETGTVTENAGPSGSIPWMAPEALRCEPITTAVDVWAIGVMLYELLTGVRPFRGSSPIEVRDSILGKIPQAPREINPKIPLDLEAVCLRCLTPNLERRYESASAVALDLERWLRDEPVRARKSTRVERFQRWCRRSPGVAISLFLTVIGLLALTTAAFSSSAQMGNRLAASVCRQNEYAARQLGVIVQRRFETIADELIKTADNRQLQTACQQQDRQAMKTFLRQQHARISNGRLKNLFILNPSGVILATSDAIDRPLTQTFAGRDYYQQAIAKANTVGLDRVHVSRVFKSENDQLDKLALATAFRPTNNDELWVIVATLTTDQTLGQHDLPTDDMKAVLIAAIDSNAPRPDAVSEEPGYVIMAHPVFGQGEKSVRFPAGVTPLTANVSYVDPVAAAGHPEYDGRWLSGAAKVGKTELIVLVQQRYDVAVALHAGVFDQFLRWVTVFVSIGVFVSLLWWFSRWRASLQQSAEM